jgi:ubiquinone/menaquinone biosynthesis C-methylase UbiE
VLSHQFARPRGLLGRVVGRTMARINAALTQRVIGSLELTGQEAVLEIGFGPGIGLELLSRALPEGRVCGADPSPLMLARARARLGRRAGQVELVEGTAVALPWADGTFDAVCAVNNVQLWEPLEASLAKVRAVLAPGGRLALGNTERAVLPGGGSVGRDYDGRLVPALEAAGFRVDSAVWARGGNGQELLVLARRAE